MLAGFHIFHKKGALASEVPHGAELYAFKTCLRTLYFGILEDTSEVRGLESFDVYTDQKAYQFLLEVICGLYSPVVGETEIFGQFRTFWQSQDYPYPLQQIFDNAVTDAKKIRKLHLTDLGGQSYGSVIRKLLKSPTSVAVIGSGSLVQDILPWIYKDENKVGVFARNRTAALNLKAKYERLDVSSLDARIESNVVIVAAPISTQELEAMVDNKDALVIDLRGDNDGCAQFKNYRDLAAFFSTIQQNQAKIIQAKNLALQGIQELSLQRFFMESLRPFGWDDICVW